MIGIWRTSLTQIPLAAGELSTSARVIRVDWNLRSWGLVSRTLVLDIRSASLVLPLTVKRCGKFGRCVGFVVNLRD